MYFVLKSVLCIATMSAEEEVVLRLMDFAESLLTKHVMESEQFEGDKQDRCHRTVQSGAIVCNIC